MTDITTAVLIVGTGVTLGLLLLLGAIKGMDKLFDASQPDDPTDPEPTAKDFGSDYCEYPEFEDKYLAPPADWDEETF